MKALPEIGAGNKRPKVDRNDAVYDFPEEGSMMLDAQMQLQMKVLQSVSSSKRSVHPIAATKPSKHPAVKEAGQWMQAERERAQERGERRWRKKFEGWQQQILATSSSRLAAALDTQEVGSRGSKSSMGNRTSSLPELLPRESRGLSHVSSLPSIRPSVHQIGDSDGFLEEEANRRNAEKRKQRDAKEAEVRRLREEELQKLRDNVEAAKQEHSRHRQQMEGAQEELVALAKELRGGREERFALERRLVQITRERDVWRDSASRREDKLRLTLQEKKDTSARLAELGALLRDLESRSIESVGAVGDKADTYAVSSWSQPASPSKASAEDSKKLSEPTATELDLDGEVPDGSSRAGTPAGSQQRREASSPSGVPRGREEARMPSPAGSSSRDTRERLPRTPPAQESGQLRPPVTPHGTRSPGQRDAKATPDDQHDNDEKLHKKAQTAIEEALLGLSDERRDSAKKTAKAALEALLDSSDGEEESQGKPKPPIKAPLAGADHEEKTEEKEEKALRRKSQLAIEAALFGPDPADEEENEEKALRRKSQMAIEAALFGPDHVQEEQKEEKALRRKSQQAIEAALFGPDHVPEENVSDESEDEDGDDDEQEPENDQQLSRKSQLAIEAALFGSDHVEKETEEDEKEEKALRRKSQLAIEAALFGPDQEEEKKPDLNEKAPQALEAALGDDIEEAPQADVEFHEDGQLRRKSQLAIEAALFGPDGAEQEVNEEDEKVLMRKTQAAIEAALGYDDDAERKKSARASAKAALEALLDSDEEDDNDAVDVELAKQKALQALGLALVGPSVDESRAMAMNALAAALVKSPEEEEKGTAEADKMALHAAKAKEEKASRAKLSAKMALEAILDESDEEEDADLKQDAQAALERAMLEQTDADDAGDAELVRENVQAAPPKRKEGTKVDAKEERKAKARMTAQMALEQLLESDAEDEEDGLRKDAQAALEKSLLAPDEKSTQVLSQSSPQRQAEVTFSTEELNATKPLQQVSGSPSPGDLVQVYSNSLKGWCAGEIHTVGGEAGEGMVKVSYTDGSMLYTKTIEWGHPNIRPQQSAQPVLPSSKSGSPAIGEQSASSEQTSKQQLDKERRAQGIYHVGDSIEIFSNSNKLWFKGRVIGMDGPAEQGQLVTCSFFTTDGTEMAKKIAMGHPNLRFAEIEEDRPKVTLQQMPQTEAQAEADTEQTAGIREKARESLTKASEDGSLTQSLIDNKP